MSYIFMIFLPLIISYLIYELFSYTWMPIVCAEITIGLILLNCINKNNNSK